MLSLLALAPGLAPAAEKTAASSLPARYADYLINAVSPAEDSACLIEYRNSKLVTGFGGLTARTADCGGAFGYRLAMGDGTEPRSLVVQYSGDDLPKNGPRILFRILADGEEVYIEGLNRNKEGFLYEVSYRLPPGLVDGKKHLSVRFEAYDSKSRVGEIYSVAIVRDKARAGLFDDMRHFSGLDRDGSCATPGAFVYTEPEGPVGVAVSEISTLDLIENYGLRLRFQLGKQDRIPLDIFASTEALKPEQAPKEDFRTRRASYLLQKDQKGEATLVVPFADFDSPTNLRGHLRKIRSLAFRLGGEGGGMVKLLSAEMVSGRSVSVRAPVRGRPAAPGQPAQYTVTVQNTEPVRQTVLLSQQLDGFEAMRTRIEPDRPDLAPGESRPVTVTVEVLEIIPPGGREHQVVNVRPSADPGAVQSLRLTTVRAMPHPFLIHTKEGWDRVRANAEKYDWARERKELYIKEAEQWGVPERPPYAANPDGLPYLFPTEHAGRAENAAIAWQLSRDPRFAEKVKKFLLAVSDEKSGFPSTLKVAHQGTVHEGGVFQSLAKAYDLIIDSGLLSAAERAQIDRTFRLYSEQEARTQLPEGANWAVSQLAGGFFSALVLQDFEQVDHFLYAPSMLADKLRSYVMPDGWWVECTVSYNSWCTEMFTQIGLALEPFGYSFLTEKFPVTYSRVPEPERGGAPGEEAYRRREINHGHDFSVRGAIERPYVTIKMLPDALVPHLDYRGVMFGINDSNEINVTGKNYELAYYAFRDPRYASIIKLGGKRDNLIYGVPELPDSPFRLGSENGAHSANAGLITLRSTQADLRERIQAVLEYGTHGGYHGHFDSMALTSLMRYGRSFFNPKMVFYIYEPYLYNFYCQSSVTKNMVTVDLKQQEADESTGRLLHTGALFQAGFAEGTSAWSYPAYGGLRHAMPNGRPFEEKVLRDKRYVPVPENHPPYGVLTGFTEPVLQRRLLLVTDDYVLIADYDASTEGKSHRYDQLFHVQGLLGLDAPRIQATGHQAQWNDDPLSASQFVTDVDTYEVTGTLKAAFRTRFGPEIKKYGETPFGEPGDLYLNFFYAWPNTPRTAYTGKAAEKHPVERRLDYSVRGDGRILAEGSFGAWALGTGKIDVDLRGVETLELTSLTARNSKVMTALWGDATVDLADGTSVKLTDFASESSNVQEKTTPPEQDYEGGPIRIGGNRIGWGLPAEPATTGVEGPPAKHVFHLKGRNAVRLHALVGGDYPVGDESLHRMTMGVRVDGPAARFLTVIEPFEKSGGDVLQSVEAQDAGHLVVKFKDGREHRISIVGMEAGGGVKASIEEYRQGKLVRKEETDP